MKPIALTILSFLILIFSLQAVSTASVSEDPLVRMPGTQPEQGVDLEAPNRCLNCHEGYNTSVEPGHNWKGSMMAQAARDPLFWACMTVAGNDSLNVLGTPNAVDICERCHFPEGWLGGRSDPPNASLMTGSDYDGVHCDVCHTMWDPFFAAPSGEDWDEASALSTDEASKTWTEDQVQSTGIKLFSGQPFFVSDSPKHGTYTENGSGQYFVSTNSDKRASFADAEARHRMLYSRYHKSKYFCGTCHDVSNPALANLGSTGEDLHTEEFSASSYFHVERTFSEFMLSDYGRPGGAATNAEFQAQGAPGITWAAKCQDCHMRDVRGAGCNKKGAPIRPDQSSEHPNSGLPLHDLTGGNVWISRILASLDPGGPVYDPVNVEILDKGPDVLTLDLSAGQPPKENGVALKAGSDRAKEQLRLAATIKDLSYSPSTGALSFTVQNNSGHKLISGFPEGRRMFLNIKFMQGGNTIYEANPYDYGVGTLKGLPADYSPNSPALGQNEAHVDQLVYEMHPSSTITGEDETFHFVLADGRYKDNRIPPKGFRIAEAASRLSEPWYGGSQAAGYYTPAEYAGGYDAVNLSDYVAPVTGADYVEVNLYYQTTSREYVEFLRDEINSPAVQNDVFFDKLKAWGNTIWDLWLHNMNLDGARPFLMTQSTWGSGPAVCDAPAPTLLSATPGNQEIAIAWSDESADPGVVGYGVYYDQAGKTQLVSQVDGAATTAYTDTGLTNGQEYCYKVTSRYADCESGFGNILCAIPNNQGQARIGVDLLETGYYQGKGKHKTFVLTDTFAQGDEVVFRAHVLDASTGLPVEGATVDLSVGGPEATTLSAGPSGSNGLAEATWQTTAPKGKKG
ncbi:MAG: multiheme c-type cytochrome, partial [Nitrospirota bacterium]